MRTCSEGVHLFLSNQKTRSYSLQISLPPFLLYREMDAGGPGQFDAQKAAFADAVARARQVSIKQTF